MFTKIEPLSWFKEDQKFQVCDLDLSHCCPNQALHVSSTLCDSLRESVQHTEDEGKALKLKNGCV